ncbi:MAG: hypothetical protein ACOYK9_02780, partial [Chlamydiia bacterium]
MAKKGPYLLSVGALTVGSMVLFPFLVGFKGRFFSEETLPLLVAEPFYKEESPPVGCGYMEYAAPLVDKCYRWDIGAAATYSQVRLQGAEIACLTSDRTVTVYPVGAVGIEPLEEFAWGFKINGNYRLNHEDWVIGAEYSYFKVVSNSSLETAYGQA